MPTLTMSADRANGFNTASKEVADYDEAQAVVAEVLMLGNTVNPGEFSRSYVLNMAHAFLVEDGSKSFTYETGREFPGEGYVKETITYTV